MISFISMSLSSPRSPISSSSLLIVAFIAMVSGCDGQSVNERVLVSGEITYDGKHVEIGQIRFIPIGSTVGPITISSIKNGQYDTQNSSGVPVGSHRVEITGFDSQEYANAPRGPGNLPITQLLPEKYNRQSVLEVILKSGESNAVENFKLVP